MDLYEKCLAEEKKYVFRDVSHEALFQLGLTLVENNRKQEGPLSVQIMINGAEVFAYYPDGTGRFHQEWMRRKANMVTMREMSSRRAALLLEKEGADLQKDWALDPKDYVACCGGFPIRLVDGSVVGTICVSGLPDPRDHEVLIEGLEIYFSKRNS